MKNHYRYFQTGEHSPWRPVPAEHAEAEARAQKALRLTILSTSALIANLEETSQAPKDLRFHGPMYFDIDNKNDLAMAIESANRLIHLLTTEYLMEERDISVYLSGTKGVHVEIAPECFGLTRSVVRLPQIYREMARRLYVSGLDLQPYSVRNAFRLTDVQRADGNYRVQVSPLELRSMTEEKYRELCSKPRNFRAPKRSNKLYTQLSLMFESATETVKRLEAGKFTDPVVIETPALREHFSEEAPGCMLQLAEGKKSEEASFNQVALQVGVFAARLNADGMGTFRPTFERIADNQKSTEYNTPRSRLEHMEGQYNYMRHTPKYAFSCNAIRGIIKSRSCCDECPLQSSKVIESPADAAKAMGIIARPDGYYDNSGKSPRRLSTFLIDPRHLYVQHQENGQVLTIGMEAYIMVNGHKIGETVFNESAWNNRTSFLKCLVGLNNAVFFGSENDIQKLKFMVYSDPDLPEKTATNEMGMHISKIEGKEIRTYVEYNASINNLRMNNTYTFEGFDNYRPFLLSSGLSVVKPGDDEVAQVLIDLLAMNKPEIMGPLIGWAAATHMKEHLMQNFQQFPLVNLWGNQGSGKTTLVRYACALGGTDFLNQHREINVAMTTPFALLSSISNARTTPVFWDELNKTGNRMDVRMYAKAVEFLKACFNGQAAQKGAIGIESSSTSKGPTVRTYFATRPVAFCSEQEPDSPALLERTISLFTSKTELHKYAGIDRRVGARLAQLKQVSYTLMLTALATPTAVVREQLEVQLESLPKELQPRVAYGLAVSMFGLRWLETVMAARDIATPDLKLAIQIGVDAIASRARDIAQKLHEMQISSEVDKVFEALFDIMQLVTQVKLGIPGARAPLQQGVHFLVHQAAGRGYLYLDLRASHSAYLEWARQKGLQVTLDSVNTFARLARQEPYVTGIHQNPEVLANRVYIQIDLDAATDRGLPTYYVWEAAKAEPTIQKSGVVDEKF